MLLVGAETDKIPVEQFWTVGGGLTQSTGAAGAQAGREASTPPRGTIDLQHSHDGTRNKQVLKLL